MRPAEKGRVVPGLAWLGAPASPMPENHAGEAPPARLPGQGLTPPPARPAQPHQRARQRANSEFPGRAICARTLNILSGQGLRAGAGIR
jgi:hypothetical protein